MTGAPAQVRGEEDVRCRGLFWALSPSNQLSMARCSDLVASDSGTQSKVRPVDAQDHLLKRGNNVFFEPLINKKKM